MKVSVIFSFRNESGNLEELVRRTDRALKLANCASYELIFVNDDSSDNSENILLTLQKNYQIIIINMSRRFGVTPCVLAGLNQATGDVAIYMDTDLQDPPELIPELIIAYQQGFDVVHTTRTNREGETWLKLFLTNMAYRIINKFSNIELPVNTGDYKLLSRRVINEILKLQEYDPYMRGLSIWVGFKQYFINYNREARFAGNAKFSLMSKGPISEFLRGLTSYSAAPLYISLILGLFVTFISFIIIIWALICKYLGVSYPGSTGILVAVSFFSGVILTTNGIIGLYISKMYYEIKRRPQFIIKDIKHYQ
jgi:dolichol-phosphate mannosyltransferase